MRHRRHADASEFAPRLFLAYLDVDALPGSLDRVPGLVGPPPRAGALPAPRLPRRRRPAARRRRCATSSRSASAADPTGPVTLLAHLRTFGWLFNPLAVYYCWTAGGDALDAVVLEVTNTPWGERHWYVLDARDGETPTTVAKAMHVSPFLPMDVEYRITWTTPGDDLAPPHRRRPRRHPDLRRRPRAAPRRRSTAVARSTMPLRHSAPAAAGVGRHLPAKRCALPPRGSRVRHPHPDARKGSSTA